MILRQYKNGNCDVILHYDGTKERHWDGIARPEFPESIDLKITDRCDQGCAFCHESSTPDGKHADPQEIFRLVSGLPQGVEIAIGGGNPLFHPHLYTIVSGLNRMGLVPNMTVRAKALVGGYSEFMQAKPFLFGIGVSGASDAWVSVHKQMNPEFVDENTVLHAIAGVDDPKDFMHTNKLLVLGYKRYGRGALAFSGKVEEGLRKWRYWLPARLSRDGITSFDNRALEQLQVREMVAEKDWKRLYMGDDGQFTMYVDAVRGEFAVSSVSERQKINGRTIVELFKEIRDDKGIQKNNSRK